MFIVQLVYKVSLEEVDPYIAAHRAFLDTGYQKNYFFASGPKNPRTGGIILSQLKDRSTLETFLTEDPFAIHSIADYDITEFLPIKFHAGFEKFV